MRQCQADKLVYYLCDVNYLTFFLRLEEVLQDHLEQIVVHMAFLLVSRGDESKDLVKKSLPRSSLELRLTLLGLLKFLDQNIHDKGLFHVVRLGADAVHALYETNEFCLLLDRHQKFV